MRTDYQRRFRFDFSYHRTQGFIGALVLTSLLFITLLPTSTLAATPLASRTESVALSPAWNLLQRRSTEIRGTESTKGWSYVISGLITLAASTPLYYVSSDTFARGVYSVAQTLSVGAVGYGSYLVLIEDDYSRFTHMVQSVPSLTSTQREELSMSFLKRNAERARGLRKIRVITHGLTAILNGLNGTTTSVQDLKIALYFIGSVNLLAAISFALSESEEEKILREIQTPARLSWMVGPVTGLAFHF